MEGGDCKERLIKEEEKKEREKKCDGFSERERERERESTSRPVHCVVPCHKCCLYTSLLIIEFRSDLERTL